MNPPPPTRFRLVLDTNTFLRGLANSKSISGRVVRACETREVILLLSRPILAEYRRVLSSEPIAVRNPHVTSETVELVLRRLRYFGEYFSEVRSRFQLDRDPDDEKFIELALAGSATHIVSFDKDLLSLPRDRTDAANRFRQRLPKVKVVLPSDFIDELEAKA